MEIFGIKCACGKGEFKYINGKPTCESCGHILTNEETKNILDKVYHDSLKKVFKCNDGGVSEWCVAENKKQAYDYMSSLWGASTMKEYEDEYFEANKVTALDEFIENFFTVEPMEKEFTITSEDDDGKPAKTTLKISEWLSCVDTVPSYFCHEDC